MPSIAHHHGETEPVPRRARGVVVTPGARGRKGDATRLGALESQVMELLWEGGAFSVRQLMDRLPGGLAYTTIATVLTNLRRKELVRRSKLGHASQYSASVSQEEYAARMMERALDAGGDRAASMLHFVNLMPEDDLELLRDFLGGRGPGDGAP